MTAELCPMMRDILEQPQLMRRCAEMDETRIKEFVQLFKDHPFQHILFCGSGTVATAGYVLKHTVRNMLGVESTLSYSSLLLWHSDFLFPHQPPPRHSLLICPAETGYTKGPVELARIAKRHGVPTVCTVRSRDSMLAKECTVAIEKLSGTERALPSTKGYTTGLLQLTVCVAAAAADTGAISPDEYAAFCQALKLLPDKCQAILDASDAWFHQWGDRLSNVPFYRIVGYGANFGTAMEGALKFEEANKRLAKAYELEEFLHGPSGAVRQGDVVIFLFGENGYERQRMAQLYRAMRSVTSGCIAVGAVPEDVSAPYDLPLPISDCQELNPVELILPLQVMACRLARQSGVDTTEVMNPAVKNLLRPSYDKMSHE